MCPRRALWDAVRAKPLERARIDAVIATLESTGALDACLDDARGLVESAWQRLDPHVEDSLPKLMLRAFGWYVLERHY